MRVIVAVPRVQGLPSRRPKTSESVMAPFLFKCPNTGFQVQGWAADNGSEDDREIYRSITCLACGGLHMVNPETGKTLGTDYE